LVLGLGNFLVGDLFVLFKFVFKKLEFQIQGLLLLLKFESKLTLVFTKVSSSKLLLLVNLIDLLSGSHVILTYIHVDLSGVKISLLVKLSLLLLNNDLVVISDNLKLRVNLHSIYFSLAVLLLTVRSLQILEQRA